jgi:guanosine-3',5'-bis(diphosphate) 3'-pyrophosphohydrolase
MEDLLCWQSKFELCFYSKKLLNKITLLNNQTINKVDLNEIKKAIYYAKKHHGDQKRDSGEPYYSHPLEVAFNVADYCFKTNILVTSILHDILEDTNITEELVKYIFGSQIAEQVESLTRVKPNGKITSAKIIELLCLQNKHELLLIKIFDRIHNMETLEAKPLDVQEKITLETLKNFLPMIAYYSLFELEKKIGDLCYKIRSKCFKPNNMLHHFDLEENYQILFQVFQNIK